MSKATAPNKVRRAWRRARNQFMLQALTGLAALEGKTIATEKRDAHQLRHYLVRNGMNADALHAVLYNAAREFEKTHPKEYGGKL